jgi:hypothetical protein
MSIFDVTLGQRPAALPATTAAPSEKTTNAPAATPLHAALAPGERPTPLCPPVIVWLDALEGELEKTLADLPPTHFPTPRIRPAEQALADIDAALRRNSARVTVNGLFDLDDHHWDDR